MFPLKFAILAGTILLCVCGDGSVRMQEMLTSFRDCEQNFIISREYLGQFYPILRLDYPIKLFESLARYNDILQSRPALQALNFKQNCTLNLAIVPTIPAEEQKDL